MTGVLLFFFKTIELDPSDHAKEVQRLLTIVHGLTAMYADTVSAFSCLLRYVVLATLLAQFLI